MEILHGLSKVDFCLLKGGMVKDLVRFVIMIGYSLLNTHLLEASILLSHLFLS